MSNAAAKNVASSVEILVIETVADSLEKIGNEIFKKYQTAVDDTPESTIYNEFYTAIQSVVNELRDEELEDEEGSDNTDGTDL